jgi:NhaA family Na+:H+ antiporter
MMKRSLQNFALLFHNSAEKGLLLLLACIVAIVSINLELTSSLYQDLVASEISFRFFHISLTDLTNEFLMAIFFLLVGLEIKREMVDGNLSKPKQRILPVAAAIGGVVVPVLIYLVFNLHDSTKVRGWAVPAATDIAFSLGILALLGKGLPVSLRVFLTALAIIDDLIAVIIIALFYSSGLNTYYLAMILVITFLIFCLNLIKLNKISLFMLMGFALWYAFYRSGIHPAVSGVVLGMCIPYKAGDSDRSLLKVFERNLSGVVQYFILPLFAFVNSGVIFSFNTAIFMDSIVLGTIAGLFIGKQLGIFATSYLLIKKKIAVLPTGADWAQFYGVAILCGIGFTMSLFVGDLAFVGPEYVNEMKLGVLTGSLISAVIGLLFLKLVAKK